MSPPRWTAQESARGFGLPSGCRLELPILHAELPKAPVRFTATRSGLDELAIAVGANTGNAVVERGIVELKSGKLRDLPWNELDRPPAFERTAAGWLAAWAGASASGERTAKLWRERLGERELARGDQLELVDLVCHEERCAALTTLAHRVTAAGATLITSGSSEGDWTRTDIEADRAVAWRPFAISHFDGVRAVVALSSPSRVALWQVGSGRAEKRGELRLKHGIFELLPGEKPLVIAAGATTTMPCSEDAFPLLVLPTEGEQHMIRGQAAPESVLARPLAEGGILLWIAPVSCKITTRTIVHAVLLRADGSPTSAPMSVADAIGFAVATRGEQLSLWLHTERGLSWIRARCSAK